MNKQKYNTGAIYKMSNGNGERNAPTAYKIE